MLVWERIGLVSRAEGFVALSGLVLGIVYRKRLEREGFRSAAVKLWRRLFQLYYVNVAVTLSIAILGLMLYAFHQFDQIRLTGARFEFAFPSLSWQVLFFSGMAIGYHKQAILN